MALSGSSRVFSLTPALFVLPLLAACGDDAVKTTDYGSPPDAGTYNPGNGGGGDGYGSGSGSPGVDRTAGEVGCTRKRTPRRSRSDL